MEENVEEGEARFTEPDLEVASTSTSTSSLFSAPSPLPPRKKMKVASATQDAMDVLQQASEHLIRKPAVDVHDGFANYIACEMRAMKNWKRVATLRSKIQQLILEANLEEIEEFETKVAVPSAIPVPTDMVSECSDSVVYYIEN